MTQIANAISCSASYIAVSTDGSTWTDISGFANKVEFDAQTRTTAEMYTFDGDTAVLSFGKLEPVEVTIGIVYSEGVAEAYEKARTAFQTAGGGRFQVRYVPAGNTAGKFQFTTGADSKISEMPLAPAAEAESADPLVLEAKVKTASITKATVSS